MRPEHANKYYKRHSYLRSLIQAEDCKEYGIKVRGKQRLSKESRDILYYGRDGYGKPTKKARKRYNKRGKKHSVEITGEDYFSLSDWRLSQALKAQNIPFKIERLYETSFKEVNKYEKRLVGQTYAWSSTSYTRCPRTGKSKPVDHYKLVDAYKWIVVGKELRKIRTNIGIRITWWSDKDIGISYILQNNFKHRYGWIWNYNITELE